MSKIINKHIQELKKQLDWKEIICIIYNPHQEQGIQNADVLFLRYLVDQVKFNYPVVLIYGTGGDFVPGLLLPRCLENGVKQYKAYVPRTCSSALCYTIFRARELITGASAQITQMDPKIPYKGEELRAIKHLHSDDEQLQSMSKAAFQTSRDQVMNLLTPPSVMKFKTMEHGEHELINTVVNLFMRGPAHESVITHKHLAEAEVNVKHHPSPKLQASADALIKKCVDQMEEDGTRVMFISSEPFKMPQGKDEKCDEAIYVCPLK